MSYVPSQMDIEAQSTLPRGHRGQFGLELLEVVSNTFDVKLFE